MGTWGFNILDDDFVRDVYGNYMEAFNAKVAPDDILRELEDKYPSAIGDDEDDGPLFVLAVAKAQWDCGHLTPETIAMVKRIVDEGLGLENWEDEGPRVLAKRKAKVAEFLRAIQAPNPKPRKPKPPTRRAPVHEPGTCLALRLKDGDYGAVLVLAAPEENRGPRKETYGVNIVGILAYKSARKPGMDVFEARQWLRLTHHEWIKENKGAGRQVITHVYRKGYKKVAEQFEVIGRSAIRPTDPQDTNWYGGWEGLEPDIMYQDAWDRGIRD